MAETKIEETSVAEKLESPILSLPAVTDQQRDLAHKSLQEFDKGNYHSCKSMMLDLSSQRNSDPKVMHNRAVAEFVASGCRQTDDLRKNLSSVCQAAHVQPESTEAMEDVEYTVIYYNQAVILYHLRRYKAALLIMDKLFPFVEPMDDTISKKVMCLLVELYLCTHQPEKAMGVLTFMEKGMGGGGGKSSSSSSHDQTGSDKGEKSERAETQAREGKEGSTESPASIYRCKISQYKIRCYLILKSLKSCKREMKGVNIASNNLSYCYLKSDFEYLRGNYRKALKLLGAVPQAHTLTEQGECLQVIYYNNLACIHFYLRKYHISAFYFRKALDENRAWLLELRRGEPGKPLSGRHINTHAINRHDEMQYNLGIQMLHCGKAQAAFDCLIESVQRYPMNPRLWHRLAECCIMANRENNDVDRDLDKRRDVIQGSVGSGIHRKLILGPGIQQSYIQSDSAAMPAPTLEFAAHCLRNALLLIPDNTTPATRMTSSPDANQSSDQDESSTPSSKSIPETTLVFAPPGNPMRPHEVANLKSSILCASAYVSLCLDDFIQAFHYSDTLLKQPHLSGAQKYLGHMYIAEAQVELDRIADAIQYLNPELITDIGTQPPEHMLDQDKVDREMKNEKGDKDVAENGDGRGAVLYPWIPRELPRARALMQYNLAAAHAIRGEHDKALKHLVQRLGALGSPLPAQVYILWIYLNLMEGHRKEAQVIIKEHFGHTTLNRVEQKMTTMSKPSAWSDTPVSGN